MLGCRRGARLTRSARCPKPGSPVYAKCQNCVCTNATDSATQLHVVSCTHVPCRTSCSQVSRAWRWEWGAGGRGAGAARRGRGAARPRLSSAPSPPRGCWPHAPPLPQGFELVDVPGECCQKCEQTHCIIKGPGGQDLILKVRGGLPMRAGSPLAGSWAQLYECPGGCDN